MNELINLYFLTTIIYKHNTTTFHNYEIVEKRARKSVILILLALLQIKLRSTEQNTISICTHATDCFFFKTWYIILNVRVHLWQAEREVVNLITSQTNLNLQSINKKQFSKFR